MGHDLWEEKRKAARNAVAPLAVRMRPRTFDEFVGQTQFLGAGKLLRRMLEAGKLTSLLFSGPPGTGKTTLAEVIAYHTKAKFERANAAMIGVKDVRRIIADAKSRLESYAIDGNRNIEGGGRTILFLDEIHRFNKAQQDVLLGDVERGLIILIGATTENPYFAVNSALVSRSTVFRFDPIEVEDIETLVRRAVTDTERGYGKLDLDVHDDAIHHWAITSDGDARRALSALEIAVLSSGGRDQIIANNTTSETDPKVPSNATSEKIIIDLETAQESIQRKALVYDGTGDEHYDVISAFIKSMRGSDPDAAIYYLARMLEAGEDPRFIARRIAIFASEDVGNADPRAIEIASAAFLITERVGLPECQLTLAQATIYMSIAAKSNASTMAILAAIEDVKQGRTVEVPHHLRDSHYPASKEKLGHGVGYEYAHNHPGGVVPNQNMGISKVYYTPTDRGLEARIAERLAELRATHNPQNDV